MGRGKLVFKGEKVKKKKHKTKHEHDQVEVVREAVQTSLSDQVLNESKKSLHTTASSSSSTITSSPQIENGIGQITTSGTVVMGHGTSFMNSLSVGDALLVQVDHNHPQEMRVITMCLSNTSINLSSPFSRNLTTPTSFQYIRKPKTTTTTTTGSSRSATNGLSGSNSEDYEKASGFQGGNELVYRESTETGSYRIKREQVIGDVSRTQLLEMRAKKKSDKYC